MKARPALTSSPAPGVLLVNATIGPWLVRADGSTRLLGPWSEGSWSPQAKYVVGHAGHRLAAVDPNAKGAVRWSLARSGAVHAARWAPDGFRVAYLNGRELRVVAGDGTGDAVLRHGRHDPARVAARRQIRARLLDARRPHRARPDGLGGDALADGSARARDPARLVGGRRAPARPGRALARAFTADGRKLWEIGPAGRPVRRRLRPQEPPLRDDPLSLRDRPQRPRAAPGRGNRGEPRFLYSAPGRLRDARDVAERQVAARRLGQSRPVALPSPERGQGEGGLEHRANSSAVDCRRAYRKAFPKASAGAARLALGSSR